MHELGIVIEIVKTVQRFAQDNNVQTIDTLVLEVGELSSAIPRFIEQCYPAAVDGTVMADTKLEIEVIPANAICKQCQHIFNLVQHGSSCPDCDSPEWGLLSGREFNIKEIVAC